MVEDDFERKLNGVLSSTTLFRGEKRYEAIKLIADAKCDSTRTRYKHATAEEMEKRVGKCVKRRILEVWMDLRQKEPIHVKGLTVVVVGDELQIEKGTGPAVEPTASP